MKMTTKKIVLTAMFAALCCVATMIIKIPSPLKGYLNLGDCIVLLSGWILPPSYAFLAAGIGSALADFFSGYPLYIPATFLIKGLMAVASHYIYKRLIVNNKDSFARLVSGFSAEVIMILGYCIFEGFLYGVLLSIANISANAVQGIAGLIIGTQLIKLFNKIDLFNL